MYGKKKANSILGRVQKRMSVEPLEAKLPLDASGLVEIAVTEKVETAKVARLPSFLVVSKVVELDQLKASVEAAAKASVQSTALPPVMVDEAVSAEQVEKAEQIQLEDIQFRKPEPRELFFGSTPTFRPDNNEPTIPVDGDGGGGGPGSGNPNAVRKKYRKPISEPHLPDPGDKLTGGNSGGGDDGGSVDKIIGKLGII